MPSWKIAQSRKNKAKQTKLAVIVLGLIILLLICSQVVRFSKVLMNPMTKSDRAYRWDGQFNINLVLKDQGISLVSYNSKDHTVTSIAVPDTTFLDVPGGFGKWQLRAVYELGGSDLLKKTLSDFFGLPLDGYVEGKSILDKNLFSLDLKTDLTLLELIRLKFNLSQVRFDKIQEIDLGQVLPKTTLPDSSEVFIFDSVKLDSVLTELFDPSFVSEQKSVAIFNATDHPALAQKAARLVSNLGGHVIITTNTKALLKKTIVIGEQSLTLKRLKQIFMTSDTIDPKDENLEASRAQINIFLGEDYYKN